jgi:tape measure domain-containing protein
MSIVENIGINFNVNTRSLDGASSKLKNMGSSISGLGKTLSLGVTAPIAGLAAFGLKYNSTMQDLQTSFKVMLGSQEKAKKMTQDLITMGAQTPFESSQLAEYTKTMLSFGYTQKNVLPIMSRLGDISLGNNEKMSSLTRTMGQINALGKLQGGDLNQLIGQGWNPLNEIMKKTGETTEQVRKRMSAGKVTYKEVEAALVSSTSKGGQFYKGMAEGAKTLSGMLSTLQDNFSMLAGELTKPIFDGLMAIMPPFLSVLGKITEGFSSLPSPVKGVVVAIAGIAASIGPVLLGGGMLITMIGSLVGAISTIAGVIGTVGLPVIAAVIAGIINFTVVIGAAVAAVVYFVNKFIPIIDTFRLFKNLVTSDVKGSLNILTDKFGMSEKAANKLVNRFIDVKNKAWQIWQVIKENLAPAFGIIKESIMNAISGFSAFNNSTGETKKNTIGLFTGIIKPIQNFLTYIYRTLDSFGLIPTKVKYANDKTALAYIELNSTVKKNLDAIISDSQKFGEKAIINNNKIYTQMTKDTKKALDDEFKFISQHLDKKNNKSLKTAEELFKKSKVLTVKQEEEKLKELKKYQGKEESDLKKKYERIKQIITTANNENRITTNKEQSEMAKLSQEIQKKSLDTLNISEKKRLAIMQEASTLSRNLSREEGMIIITEANKTYDKKVETAKKTKRDTIAQIISMRDETKVIKKDEADAMIREANRAYEKVTGDATKTKNKAISEAIAKANGTVTEADREAREIIDKSEKINDAVTTLWEDLKEKIPGIVADLVTKILKELGSRLKTGVENAMKDAFSSWWDMPNMFSMGPSPAPKKSTSKKKSSTTKKATTKKVTKSDYYSKYRPGAMGKAYATGTRFAEGGLSLVGERGAELVNIPRMSQVYNNQKTQNIIGSGGGKKEITINVYETSNAYETANEIAKRFRMGGLQ